MLAWLNRHAPDRVTAAQKLFGAMAEEHDKWPGRTDHVRVKEVLVDVQALAAFVRETGRKLPAAADPRDDAVWDMTLIEQWLISNGGGLNRAEWMGRNLNHLLDCYPGIKVLTSAFNNHIAHSRALTSPLAVGREGRILSMK